MQHHLLHEKRGARGHARVQKYGSADNFPSANAPGDIV